MQRHTLSPHPEFTEVTLGFVVDEIENGLMAWRGVDLFPTIAEARDAIAEGLRYLRAGWEPSGRYDFRIQEAQLDEDSLIRGGTVSIHQYTLYDDKLRKVRNVSQAI